MTTPNVDFCGSINFDGKCSNKSLVNDQVHLIKNINRTVLFQGCQGQFLVSIKPTGLDIWKKSLKNEQYYLFFLILGA